MSHLLVVEDEAHLLSSLSRGLQEEGYVVHAVATCRAADRVAAAEPLDAVILDLMLPDGDGLTWLRSLRQRGFAQPVLILTARDAVEDRIRGLDGGADDYVTKPFAFDELLARLRVLFRRSTPGGETVIRCRDLEMDLLQRRVTRAGVEVHLTQRQFELLGYLLRHAGEVVSREMIARDVWKESTATWTNVIEVQINHLRKKIERDRLPAILHTIRGQGYVLGDAKCTG